MSTISQIAVVLQDALETWAQPRGGIAVVASNVRDMWETAFKASDKPRIFIVYAGETIRGDFPEAAALHRVDREWQVAITRGRGFTTPRGKMLTDTVQNAEPFYDSVETVRDIIRSIIGISEETPVDFKSIEPMNMGNKIIDGYLINFSTANDLPGLSSTPPDVVNPQPPPPSGT